MPMPMQARIRSELDGSRRELDGSRRELDGSRRGLSP